MVSIHIQKIRKNGLHTDFQFAFTPESIKESGISRSVEFSRAGESEFGSVQYKAQWSLANGVRHPKIPSWKKLTEGSVTLYPPVMPKNIRLQVILEELRSSNISKVLAKIRFRQFEKFREIKLLLSTYKHEDMITTTIFVDKDQPEIEYQLTFYHNEKGPVKQAWEKMDLAMIGSLYTIDALVPHEFFIAPQITEAQGSSQANDEIFIEEKQPESNEFEIILKE
jgi:hypothetical protein